MRRPSIDIEEVFDAHDRRNAVAEAETEIRMRRDPEFRTRIEAAERDEAAEILAERARLAERRRAKAQRRDMAKPATLAAANPPASESTEGLEVDEAGIKHKQDFLPRPRLATEILASRRCGHKTRA